MLGFNGVRNGDLNGFWSVFVASFSRRRFACGVDIFAVVCAFGTKVVSSMWWDGECLETRDDIGRFLFWSV
jgi:hypothetical protein